MYIDIMNTDFTSNVNKTLLWDLIKDTKIFINVASVSKREYIIDIFEAQISNIADSTNAQASPLTELNKQFLNNMIVTLQQQIAESVPSQPLSKETKADMQQQRASLFEERLKKKQNEFYKHTAPPPPKLSFKDEDEIPIDVSADLERMQMSRVADMEKVTFTTNQNWDFSSMKSEEVVGIGAESMTTPQLKIDHASNISSPVDAVINKKVSWSNNEGSDNLSNFVERLKQKKEDVNSTLLGQIKSDLREIKNIQYKILDIMTKQDTLPSTESLEIPQYSS
jgi:hypothetical protein